MMLAGAVTAIRAGESPTSKTDSIADALATYWGAAVNTSRMSAGEREAFARGFSEAYAANDSLQEAYLRGGLMGVGILRSVDEAAGMGLEVNRARLGEALAKVLRGGSTGMSETEAREYIDAQIDPAGAKAQSGEAQKAFVDSMAALPGAVTTPSGLVFIVETEGEGAQPVSGDEVEVTYTGRLSDGSVFDSTDSPITFGVDRVVPGFSEGLKLMKPGGRYRIVMPASLAYGERGAGGGIIPPGAAVDFTVDLIGIKPRN